MQTFLEKARDLIIKNHKDVSNLVLIVPSVRAAKTLKSLIKQSISKTTFFPKIIPIESFLEDLSGLTTADPTTLLFTSYQAYLNTSEFKEKDDFLTFNSWIATILNDFNEIDRYLLDSKSFFTHIKNVQEINQWAINQTPLISRYLKFWEALPFFYDELKSLLLTQNLGYQGMISRKAAEDIEHYINKNAQTPHYFIGFNALTKAESVVMQELLETKNTIALWDIDSYFLNDKEHGASHFLNTIFSTWKYYKTQSPLLITSHFETKKDIQIVEASTAISQVKYIGNLIQSFSEDKLMNTVIVLADEKLLKPLIYSLPQMRIPINITMGLTLVNLPGYDFFSALLNFQQASLKSHIYYKDVLPLLQHPFIKFFTENNQEIIDQIKSNNITHFTNKEFTNLLKPNTPIVKKMFEKWENNFILTTLLELVNYLKEQQISSVDLTTLYELNTIFISISKSLPKHLESIETISHIVQDIAQKTTIDFEGDATQGVQVMGMLETRTLDFDTVIIASVNEGILPAKVVSNSYIPLDVKKAYEMPLPFEKEHIFSYHFYRLLSRASDITLLYSTGSNGLQTAEKSRFIHQIEQDKSLNHIINHIVLAPAIAIPKPNLLSITKNEEIINTLKERANKGISPSALISYIRNPIDFYNTYVLGIKETSSVEEDIAANTFGTIVHDTLENLYKPLLNQQLTVENLTSLKKQLAQETEKQFLRHFQKSTLESGKNVLVFEVIKRYIFNFINTEIEAVKKGNKIILLQLEQTLKTSLFIEELGFPITFKGKIDRIDLCNEELRIIDYKTGKVEPKNLKVFERDVLITEYEYSKGFQVLLYALMVYSEKPFARAKAGIISFKNLKAGFMPFGIKEKDSPQSKTFDWITKEELSLFKEQLVTLLVEIFNKEIPFLEKEI